MGDLDSNKQQTNKHTLLFLMSQYNFLIVALQSYQTLTKYQKTVVGTHPITVVEEGTIALSYRGEGLTSELSGNLGLVNGKN